MLKPNYWGESSSLHVQWWTTQEHLVGQFWRKVAGLQWIVHLFLCVENIFSLAFHLMYPFLTKLQGKKVGYTADYDGIPKNTQTSPPPQKKG